MRLRAAREDIQDQGRAVENLDLEQVLEFSLLRGSQFIVGDHQVVLERLFERGDFLEFAAAKVGSGQRMIQALRYGANNLNSCRFRQPCQFLQRVLDRPTAILLINRDQECIFGWLTSF